MSGIRNVTPTYPVRPTQPTKRDEDREQKRPPKREPEKESDGDDDTGHHHIIDERV